MYRDSENGVIEMEIQESSVPPQEEAPKYSYAGYVACGGRIDEVNYRRVMKAVQNDPSAAMNTNRQTEITAEISGVSLEAIRNDTGIDPRAIYGILRNDHRPPDATDHHVQMSDQQLLVESLRMLEQESAVQAIIDKHPHIGFN